GLTAQPFRISIARAAPTAGPRGKAPHLEGGPRSSDAYPMQRRAPPGAIGLVREAAAAATARVTGLCPGSGTALCGRFQCRHRIERAHALRVVEELEVGDLIADELPQVAHGAIDLHVAIAVAVAEIGPTLGPEPLRDHLQKFE